MDWTKPPDPGKQFDTTDLTTKHERATASFAMRGRPKGVKNKGTISFLERMEELRSLGLDCDPIQVLMEVAIGKKLVKRPGSTGEGPMDFDTVPLVGGYDKQNNPMDVDAATKAKAASELCSYIYPKRKAIELSSNDGNPITFAIMADLSPLPGESPDELPADESAELPAGRPADLALPPGVTIEADQD